MDSGTFLAEWKCFYNEDQMGFQLYGVMLVELNLSNPS